MFTEQVLGLDPLWPGQFGPAGVLRAIAQALGGHTGARLAIRLAAGANKMTLIRLLRGLPEFALRPGHSYGTLLVHVQTRRPIDILPERSAG